MTPEPSLSFQHGAISKINGLRGQRPARSGSRVRGGGGGQGLGFRV